MKYLGNQLPIEIMQSYSDKWDYVQSTNPAIDTNPSTPYVKWLNITTGQEFVCTDNTAGSNIWIGTNASEVGTADPVYYPTGSVESTISLSEAAEGFCMLGADAMHCDYNTDQGVLYTGFSNSVASTWPLTAYNPSRIVALGTKVAVGTANTSLAIFDGFSGSPLQSFSYSFIAIGHYAGDMYSIVSGGAGVTNLYRHSGTTVDTTLVGSVDFDAVGLTFMESIGVVIFAYSATPWLCVGFDIGDLTTPVFSFTLPSLQTFENISYSDGSLHLHSSSSTTVYRLENSTVAA